MSKLIETLSHKFFLSQKETDLLSQLAKRNNSKNTGWYLLVADLGVQCNICHHQLFYDEIVEHGRNHLKHIILFI